MVFSPLVYSQEIFGISRDNYTATEDFEEFTAQKRPPALLN
jgi:hypothetical protein